MSKPRPVPFPNAREAAMLADTIEFRTFLVRARGRPAAITADGATAAIRELTDVTTRKTLDLDEPARRRWRDLVAEFKAWQRGV